MQKNMVCRPWPNSTVDLPEIDPTRMFARASLLQCLDKKRCISSHVLTAVTAKPAANKADGRRNPECKAWKKVAISLATPRDGEGCYRYGVLMTCYCNC